ncbi:ornithine cyclodeaminase family protein [Staphylococcus pettenkoferi]|uniref:ornithine cyclodeaminase family protein n=1 Tax=Staphylococcus pettenkoferi TaxID=170573 RepID=UPI0002432146|nr:ornithine cyclodeaminase family protein [Staphylococcus pettenkoferi]ASE37525.1 ornithine cyclodeaminase [Staphylococcus pettenkoferi]EHM71347.1 ornithine cyclodeaminase [Staphylococcus pettenkoferi VCU012]MCY1580793.1 ornithine cyclodeaminase family protein [Staphylococcus pettenkoferi]
MRYISAKDQRDVMDMKEVVKVTGQALQAYSEGKTETPLRYTLPFNDDNRYLVMPAICDELKATGVKIVSFVPGNPQRGKQTIEGSVMLTDRETGETLAVLDGAFLTKIRTGAISGVATQYMAREDADTLCVIGTGEQAEGLIEAVLAVRDIKRIQFFNRTHEKAVRFADEMKARFDHLETEVFEDVDDAMKGADVVVTATNSPKPVFEGKLDDGVHLNAVGSFKPDMQELPSDVLAHADKVAVESKNAALEETGDFIEAMRAGKFEEVDLYGELGRIVSGELTGRDNDDEVTVFKSVGLAIVDIVVAQYFYEKLAGEK